MTTTHTYVASDAKPDVRVDIKRLWDDAGVYHLFIDGDICGILYAQRRGHYMVEAKKAEGKGWEVVDFDFTGDLTSAARFAAKTALVRAGLVLVA